MTLFPTCILPLLEEVIIDLARAEDELPDAIGALRSGTVIGNEAFEIAARDHLVERGPALWQAEKGLWCHDDQRLAERQRDLG